MTPDLEEELRTSHCRCGGKFLVKSDTVFVAPGAMATRTRALCVLCGRLLRLTGSRTEWVVDGNPRPVEPWAPWSRYVLQCLGARDTHRAVADALSDESLLAAWRAGRAAHDVAAQVLLSGVAR